MKSIRNYFSRFVNRIAIRLRKTAFAVLERISLSPGENKLLVVRLDAIGDYILFRNELPELKRSKRFENHKITLLGNILWKELSEHTDKQFVDEFIWVNPKKLFSQEEYPFEQLKLLTRLKLKRFSVVLHPVHSRMLETDIFLSKIKTPQLIGSRGDETNYKAGEKSKADALYSELIDVPDHSNFEFFRNAHFISKLTGNPIEQFKLRLDLNTKPESNKFIIIISPGAGHAVRRWPIDQFGEVCRQLGSIYQSAFFYICGTGDEKELGEHILAKTNKENIRNMCGKLTLLQYAELIKEASLVISNESSSVHFAAALDTPAVCISNGNMFGRFNPYPPEVSRNIKTIYSDDSFLNTALFAANVERTRIRSVEDISLVTAEKVTEAAVRLLQDKIKADSK